MRLIYGHGEAATGLGADSAKNKELTSQRNTRNTNTRRLKGYNSLRQISEVAGGDPAEEDEHLACPMARHMGQQTTGYLEAVLDTGLSGSRKLRGKLVKELPKIAREPGDGLCTALDHGNDTELTQWVLFEKSMCKARELIQEALSSIGDVILFRTSLGSVHDHTEITEETAFQHSISHVPATLNVPGCAHSYHGRIQSAIGILLQDLPALGIAALPGKTGWAAGNLPVLVHSQGMASRPSSGLFGGRVLAASQAEFRALLKPRSPLVALDIGSRRTGLAISDISGTLAVPMGILRHDERGNLEASSCSKFLRLFKRFPSAPGTVGIIAGRPLNLQGKRGDTCLLTENILRAWLYEHLVAMHIILLLKDERFSSRYAEDVLGCSQEQRDEAAATLLLQEYLAFCAATRVVS